VAAALRHGNPALRPLGSILDAAPLAPIASAGYDLVARNRHRLPGGTPSCGITPPDRSEPDAAGQP
jgi:predicted DCC family thiol-disulfide oxidoreductase YuxK